MLTGDGFAASRRGKNAVSAKNPELLSPTVAFTLEARQFGSRWG
jgi:hypothetical protein